MSNGELPTIDEINAHIETGEYGQFREMLHAPQTRSLGDLFKTLSPDKKIGKLSNKNIQKQKTTGEKKTEAVEAEKCALGVLDTVFLSLCIPGKEMVTGKVLWTLFEAAKKYDVPFKFVIFPNLNSEKDKGDYEDWKRLNASFLAEKKENILFLDDLKKDPEWTGLKEKYFDKSHVLDKVVEADCKQYLSKHENVDATITRDHIIDSAVSFLYFHSKTKGRTNGMIYPKEPTDTMLFLRAIVMAEGKLDEAALLQIKYDNAGPEGQLTKFARADKKGKAEKQPAVVVPEPRKKIDIMTAALTLCLKDKMPDDLAAIAMSAVESMATVKNSNQLIITLTERLYNLDSCESNQFDEALNSNFTKKTPQQLAEFTIAMDGLTTFENSELLVQKLTGAFAHYFNKLTPGDLASYVAAVEAGRCKNAADQLAAKLIPTIGFLHSPRPTLRRATSAPDVREHTPPSRTAFVSA